MGHSKLAEQRPTSTNTAGDRLRPWIGALLLSLLPATVLADSLPWRSAGLTEREAAAHLLDRFTYGPRPGEIDLLVAQGLEEWLEGQLAGDLPEPALGRLGDLHPLHLSPSQIAETYPSGSTVMRLAQSQGVLSENDDEARSEVRQREGRRELLEWASEQGYRREGELTHALLTQKVLRAVSAENQLTEVLVDFWFNHFNVSLTEPRGRVHVLSYERDAIRPNVLGDFRSMLGATARHPAMLLYLDNALSSAEPNATTLLDSRRQAGQRNSAGRSSRRWGANRVGSGSMGRGFGQNGGGFGRSPNRPTEAEENRRRPRGLNENYARELLELHTLGVDGGYLQEDIEEVARAFSGWTVLPMGPGREEALRRLAEVQRNSGHYRTRNSSGGAGRGAAMGIVVQGDFLFRPDHHDAGRKQVLGERLPANRGIEDGEDVLDIVAQHPATAHHLSRKLASQFVSDHPPEALVDRLTQTFTRSEGNLRTLIRAIAYSPEFWSSESRSQKIKSPFDLAISSVRAVGGSVDDAAGLVDWIGRMGQPLYRYQAPTGYPDTAESWTNAGALLSRMNFGLALASGLVAGVEFEPTTLIAGFEPVPHDQALHQVASILLPERQLAESLARLEPIVEDPAFTENLAQHWSDPVDSMTMDVQMRRWENPFPAYSPKPTRTQAPILELAQIIGVLLGSPEFQRQ